MDALNFLESFPPEKTPVVVLSEGCFGEASSKLALGVLRYGRWPIVSVVDSTRAGQTVLEASGLDSQAPVVSSLEDALSRSASPDKKPQALLLGIAPPGGKTPESWISIIQEAIRCGLHIINGLHVFLNDNPDLVQLAKQHQITLWDVRNPEGYGVGKFHTIPTRKLRPSNARIVLTVGTDCNVGKMHSALELYQTAQEAGASAGFVATGQTGILISGSGVPLDRVIGDFMAGAVETCINEELERLEQINPGEEHWVFVEGQGSLTHPAYSGVTLALIHGSNPDALVLCHKATSSCIRVYPDVVLPTLTDTVKLYEQAAAWAREKQLPRSRVIGISVNTSMLPEEEALQFLDNTARETGLPSIDPVRQGAHAIWQSLLTDVTSKRSA